jgi:Anti-sigma-K factor rskA
VEAGTVPVPAGDSTAGSNGIALATPAAAVRREPQAGPYAVPRQQRVSGATIATLAAVAGMAAIGLGLWAFVESVRDEVSPQPRRPASSEAAQAISLLSKPTTVRIPFAGADGWITLAVASTGRGLLVLEGIRVAPVGRTYQAWVVPRGARSEPLPAAVFSGVEGVVPLTARVKQGFRVGITIERPGGAPAPTKAFRLSVERPARRS